MEIEESALAAAKDYAVWSAAAAFRLLASQCIEVRNRANAESEPFLGRGRMPVLEIVMSV